MRSWVLLFATCLVGMLALGSWLVAATLQTAPPLPAAAPPTAAVAIVSVAAEAPARETVPAIIATNLTPLPDAEWADPALAPNAATRILVVRGDPPTPVPQAIVYFLTGDEGRARAQRHGHPLPEREWPETFGARVETDDQGIAELPLADQPMLCAARSGDEFGLDWAPPREHTRTIALVPDETVTLIARQGEEAPAVDVPVAIVQGHDGEEATIVWQGATDRRGRAVVRHFQLVRANRAATPTGERFAATAAVPGAIAKVFVGRPASSEPIELTVPPLGSVRLLVVDHKGEPVLSRADVGLRGGVQPKFANEQTLALPERLVQSTAAKPPGSAPVLVPWQGVGGEVSAYARFPLDRQPAGGAAQPGPQAPGGTADVRVTLRPDQVVVAGRFAQADGAPVEHAVVAAALWSQDEELWSANLDSVRDGRFDFVCKPRAEFETFLELRLNAQNAPAAVRAALPDDGAQRLGARVRIPRMQPHTRIELGTITLAPLPPLVTGYVVDDLGAPVVEADVHVQQENPQTPKNHDPWRMLSLFRTRTDADGGFRIDGFQPAGKLRVRADTDLHFADSVPLHTQGQNVRIRIERNGILRGRILLPDWLPDGAATLTLQPLDESLRQRNTRSVELSRRNGGRFVVEPLRTGRYDAVVTVRNLAEPVAVQPDVFVQPGETRDARFRPLDLREALHRYKLRAVDQASVPLGLDGPILARVTQRDGKPADLTFRWRNGHAELITTSHVANFTFFGRGHQTVRMLLASGDTDVVLPATRPSLVTIPGIRALMGPHRKVRVSAVLVGDTGLPANLTGIDQHTGERFSFARSDLGRSSGGWLGASDTVEIPLMQDGTYEILLRPHAGDTEQSPQRETSLGRHRLRIDRWEPVRVQAEPLAVSRMLQQLDAQWLAQRQQKGAPGAGRGR
ncbi:MAG: carboxypeptidase regulatory-like domain-containing protein [Planctomycetes bacterium]|nr:carboxypeptidase regulatory-like domain-containing protein [Planctomycetota bacterium]